MRNQIATPLTLFFVLAAFAAASEKNRTIDLQDNLNKALRQLTAGNVEGAKTSVRSAARCDAIPDAREVQPIGVTHNRQFRASLMIALKYIDDGHEWRAADMARKMAGCYSLTLMLERRGTVRTAR